MKRLARFIVIATVLAGLSACSLTPTYERPSPPMPQAWDDAAAINTDAKTVALTETGTAAVSPAVPGSVAPTPTADASNGTQSLTPSTHAANARASIGVTPSTPPAVPTAVTSDWWTRYGSSELDDLMSRALAANHDLSAAASRIEQSRATLRSARGQRLPQASASASGSRSRQEINDQNAYGSADEALITVSYEADLWGGLAASENAADARLAATIYDKDSIALVLQADVATNYFNILAQRERIAIAEENATAARELLRLVQVRFENGGANALEVAQQRTALLSIEAQIPLLQQTLSATRTALAVLLGEAPQAFNITGQPLTALALPTVLAEQPASLLERRPDFKAVEASLMAANADIGAARATLFPNLSLSASAGVAGALTGGSTTLASLAASLTQVLFDGGQRKASVDFAYAERSELAENYAQTVLTGLKEVQDSLVDVETATTRIRLLTELAEQARKAYGLAHVRYESGADDLLTLLDSQRVQLDAEDNLVQAQASHYTATTSLFKALGGGWVAPPTG